MPSRKRPDQYAVVEEPFPKSFPASYGVRRENEAAISTRLSGLDEWKLVADKLGRLWLVTSEQRRREYDGKLLRTFCLYVQGGLHILQSSCGFTAEGVPCKDPCTVTAPLRLHKKDKAK